jgi:putative tryptophan/tyrosine transport system substrate-binding protein
MATYIRRREFMFTLGGAAAAWPRAVRAQQQPSKPARIGYLSAASAPDVNIENFRGGMHKFGYAEGPDFVIEPRYAERDYSRFPALIEELLRAKVELIVTGGPSSRAAPLAGRSVPVVFGFSGDPVEAGIVKSFARPATNATGMSFLSLDLAAKRVEMLKEAAPTVTRLAVLSNPEHAGEASEMRVTREAARNLGLEVVYFPVETDDFFEPTFGKIAGSDCDALIVFPDALTIFHRQAIAVFAQDANLPSIFGWKPYVEAGGLMSYGPNLREAFARLAFYVDKILKGAKPSDLPVEQPTKLELAINLKTAKALGLTLPMTLQARADEVIE